MDEKSPAEKLAAWADVLRGITANGLHFASNIYDRSNYERIQQVALEMTALATGQPLAEIEPLKGGLFTRPGPIPTVDAAIFDQENRILLIRRADNHKWAMPGGGIDMGETPAEGAIREAFEETGVRAEPLLLAAVHDSRFTGGRYERHQLYHFLFVCRPLLVPPEPASHANEVLETAWFAQPDLPADLDLGHVRRIAYAFKVWQGETRAYFDPPDPNTLERGSHGN